MGDQHIDDEEEGENKRSVANGGGDLGGGVGRLYGWPSSRIFRVSRASGGKDRHSKVLTSKGLRDRRVRLSVNTAIQFYDLQDRLGYDQPSKAVEWLLTAAARSIAQLPPMNSPFLDTPKQLNDHQRRPSTAGSYSLGLDSAEVDGGPGGDGGNSSQLQQESATKSSAGSSNSETSKGSGISISRSEGRIKARERAKERAAEKEKEREEKEKERENESCYVGSFTELLSGRFNCINGRHNSNSIIPDGSVGQNYFASGLLGPPENRPAASPLFSVAADHHSELQPFSFAPDNLVSAVNSPGLNAINRGTLQSNISPSPPSLLPMFPPTAGSSPNFFIGAAPPIDNHHHFLPEFDSRLHLYYGDAHGSNSRHSGQKER